MRLNDCDLRTEEDKSRDGAARDESGHEWETLKEAAMVGRI